MKINQIIRRLRNFIRDKEPLFTNPYDVELVNYMKSQPDYEPPVTSKDNDYIDRMCVDLGRYIHERNLRRQALALPRFSNISRQCRDKYTRDIDWYDINIINISYTLGEAAGA